MKKELVKEMKALKKTDRVVLWDTRARRTRA